MILINTLSELQIDNVPIHQIDLNARVINILITKTNIKTLLDLKNYVLEKGIIGLLKLNGFGTISKNNVKKLLEHAYPKTNFNMYVLTEEKYTFN